MRKEQPMKKETEPAEEKRSYATVVEYVEDNQVIAVAAADVPIEIKELKGTGWIGYRHFYYVDGDGNIIKIYINHNEIASMAQHEAGESGAFYPKEAAKQARDELLQAGFLDIRNFDSRNDVSKQLSRVVAQHERQKNQEPRRFTF